LWIVFTETGCLLTYLGATGAFPLQDNTLANLDHFLGFDWLACRNFVVNYPHLHLVLAWAYKSLLWQILFTVIFLSALGRSERCAELLLLAAFALLITVPIAAFWPALGPFATFGGDQGLTAYLPHLLALRAGAPWHFSPPLQGIITMPSYHTVLAILLTYAYRGTGPGGGMGPVGWAVAVLNGVMLVAIAPIGGHYFVDMIGGGAIALLCILGSRRELLIPGCQAVAAIGSARKRR
jgi:membrane-associated phospholipid phosphatase